MIGFEGIVSAAVGTGPVPFLEQLDPFQSPVRTLSAELARAASSVNGLPDVAVFAAVLREVRSEVLFVPLVVGAI
jgi:hypothetical protein